ncbi:hypothetical protein PGN42_10405 [Klebsiella aerogenes]
MTDITELAAVLRLAAESEIAYRAEGDTSDLWQDEVSPANILALVEALEKAQSTNAAQDDHINQQQDRIEQLEKRNAELGKYAKELESFRTAYMEWSDKTDWVQGDKRFDVLIPWGKHRADVLKAYIEHLEQRIAELEESHAQVIQSRDHYKRMSEEGLKQLAESRTVKLPDDEDGQAYGFGRWANGKLPATTGAMTISYCEDAWRAAFEVFSSAAGIKWEAERCATGDWFYAIWSEKRSVSALWSKEFLVNCVIKNARVVVGVRQRIVSVTPLSGRLSDGADTR